MHILAWICFIWIIVDMIVGMIKVLVTEKTPTDRVEEFIANLLYLIPFCFFYIYLFRG